MCQIKVLGLSLYGSSAASHRIRLGQYKAGLLKEGIDLQIQALLDDSYLKYRFEGGELPIANLLASLFQRLRLLLTRDKFNLVILHCELIPFAPSWFERFFLRLPYIYDFDDAWYLRYKYSRSFDFSYLLRNKVDNIMIRASAIAAGSNYLENYASKFNSNVTVLPSVVDTNRFHGVNVTKANELTIGWIGSASTAKYLRALVEPLSIFRRECKFRFIVVGGKAPDISDFPVIELPWAEDTEVALINTLDVGLMPLPDDDWARGKCAFKLVQYMACGLPVIASRVGANIELVTKDCGFLVETVSEWVDALRWMRDNRIERHRMGAFGRARVESHYSLTSNLPKLARLVRQVSGA
jgi:glycosyltransferase involved in cell wall biosynthesis